LLFFDVEHAPFFFGREALIEWLINNLRPSTTQEKGNRFLAIIGASGSGKSSLARAGLIDGIKKGRLEGSENWPIVICRPGTDPLESLSVAFEQTGLLKTTSLTVFNLIKQLKNNERTLHIATRSVLNSQSYQHLVLLIDQFEELFTLCKNKELRQGFIDNLVYASSVAQGKTIVLLTLGADFYSQCAPYTSFAATLSDHQMLVGSMTKEEFQSAIESPAQLVGCEFESGLVETLLHDVKDQSGALPLLQHALLELWKQKQGNRLTKKAYQDIGGIEGSLEKRAEAVYSGFNETEKQICRKLFLRLTQVGDGTADTKRQMKFKEIVTDEGEREVIEAVVLKLSSPESRLVITEGGDKQNDRVIEVAHEALIRGWKRLRKWLDEDREFLLWRQKLRVSLGEWIRTNQDEGILLRGASLLEANRWLKDRENDLSENENNYLNHSITLQEQEQQEKEEARNREMEHLRAIAEEQEQKAKAQEEAAKKAEELRINAEKLAKEEEHKTKAQRKANRFLGVIILIVFIAAVIISFGALEQKDKAIQTKIALAQAQFAMNQRLDSLKTGIEAKIELENTLYKKDDTKKQVDDILSKLINGVKERNRFNGHDKKIEGLSYSPDGLLIASSSEDQTVKLWNRQGLELDTLKGHSNWVNKVSFSPDSKLLATASSDHDIRLWQIKCLANEDDICLKTSHKPSHNHVLKGHKDWVTDVGFSPDGNKLVSSSKDGTIIIWDKDGNLINGPIKVPNDNHRLQEVWGIGISQDAQLIATANADNTIKLFNFNGELLDTLTGHTDKVKDVSFSPKGEWIVSCGEDQKIIIWQKNDSKFEPYKPIEKAHDGSVNRVNFSHDGKIIASVSDGYEKNVKLWYTDDGTLISTFNGHIDRVKDVIFSLDDKTLITGSWDKTLRVWNKDKFSQRTYEGHTDKVIDVSFSPYGNSLVSASWDKTVRLWDIAKRTKPIIMPHNMQVNVAIFSPSGREIVTAGERGNVFFWNINSISMRYTFKAHDDYIKAMDFGDNGRILATIGGTKDPVIKLWNLDGMLYKSLKGHTDGIYGISFSPDGNMIVSGGKDNTVKVWDTKSGALIETISGHEGWVWSVAFSHDGHTIASASEDATVKLWNLKGELINTLRGHEARVSDVAFSPNDKIIATGSADTQIKLWNREEGKLIATLEGHNDRVMSVSFSPDGNKLASAGVDHNVKIWNIKNLQAYNSTDLLLEGCKWLKEYLKTNNKLQNNERSLCDKVLKKYRDENKD